MSAKVISSHTSAKYTSEDHIRRSSKHHQTILLSSAIEYSVKFQRIMYRLKLSLVLLLLVQQFSVVHSKSIHSPKFLLQDEDLQDENAQGQEEVMIPNERLEDLDMMDGSSQDSLTHTQNNLLLRRKRGADDPTPWDNNRIPFEFVEPFPKRYKRQVSKAISVWHKRSCVEFVDRTNETYFASFKISQQSCSSRVGMKKWRFYANRGQPVLLAVRCLKKRGLIMHELGHLIGLYHEHQRPDRDLYLKIIEKNIIPGSQSQFRKYDFSTYGPYDFGSIMHYPLNSFSRTNTSAMQILPNATHLVAGINIGLQHSLSTWDGIKVNRFYKCADRPPKSNDKNDINGDNIYSGEQVGLSVNGTDFVNGSWLSCNEYQCEVNNCPGKKLRENDKELCPNNIFTLHKLSNGSKVIRVGDEIVMEHKSYGKVMNSRLFVSCNPKTKICSLSSECSTDDKYNATFCRENILVVRAEGKNVGEPITHRDFIGFEFKMPDIPQSHFRQQCALGCNSQNGLCSKVQCIFVNHDALHLGGGGNSSSNGEEEVCGKDMFFIQKF